LKSVQELLKFFWGVSNNRVAKKTRDVWDVVENSCLLFLIKLLIFFTCTSFLLLKELVSLSMDSSFVVMAEINSSQDEDKGKVKIR